MTDLHPITPPFELTNQWHKEACKDPYNGGAFIESKVLKYITTAAAQWGANQELEALLSWLRINNFDHMAKNLLATRRPKPPSETDLALERLELAKGYIDVEPIYRALQRLKKLEEATND
jgi:hypothetical protein